MGEWAESLVWEEELEWSELAAIPNIVKHMTWCSLTMYENQSRIHFSQMQNVVYYRASQKKLSFRICW